MDTRLSVSDFLYNAGTFSEPCNGRDHSFEQVASTLPPSLSQRMMPFKQAETSE